MLVVFDIVVRWAILLGVAFILSKIVPSMPNKLCRFVLLFVLLVPFNFVVNYFDFRLLGLPEMDWIETSILALVVAILGMFWPLQPQKSNT